MTTELVEEKVLIASVTDEIVRTMERDGVSNGEMARRLGVTKALVGRNLSGRNLTLKTVSRMLYSLGYRLTVKVEPIPKRSKKSA